MIFINLIEFLLDCGNVPIRETRHLYLIVKNPLFFFFIIKECRHFGTLLHKKKFFFYDRKMM